MVDRGEMNERWCILRTGGARTLPLVTSLTEAGIDAWTPTQMIKRIGRGKLRHSEEDRPAAITPTFVFARAIHVGELLAIVRRPINPHTSFSVLRHHDRVPLVAESGLKPLREAEDRSRLRHLRTTRTTIAPGTRVKLSEGAFAGMTGIVERGNGKAAIVNFCAGFEVSIATYILESNIVQDGNKPVMGIAA